jgi:nucleoside-diphosphate-sugar epimerase
MLLVTGASGFVGHRVCADAVRGGLEVRGAVRRDDAALRRGVQRVVVREMADPTGWAAALAGVERVIHLAARVHVMREQATDPLSAFREVNVDGTRALVRAAAAAGVTRFVYVSTVKVHGEGRDRPYSSDDPLRPADPYGQSKAEAEAVVQSEGAPMTRVVVRPPLVYGPAVGGNFGRLLNWSHAAARWPLPLGGIDNRRSLVFVGNLANALLYLATAEDDDVVSGSWLVSDGEDLSTSELLARLGRAAGRPVRLVPVPESLLSTLARFAGRSAEANRLLGSLTVDSSPLRSIGWIPPFTVDEGLRETVRWWQNSRERKAS